MPTKLLVCMNSSCSSQGSQALVRDIEELAGGSCDVEEWGCLGKCGKGPNIEIQEGGSKKLKSGVSSFKKACSLVEEAGGEITPEAMKVGKIKYELRREQDADKKMTKLMEAFTALGGEKNTSDKMQLASLLVLRSQMYIKQYVGSALKDAERAAQLAPQWAQANIAWANALEACAQPVEAAKAVETALQIGTGINAGTTKRLLKRMERKAEDQSQEDPATVEERRNKALALIAPPMGGSKPSAKSKAKAKSKGEAKAKAKPKAKAIEKKKEDKEKPKKEDAPVVKPEVTEPAAEAGAEGGGAAGGQTAWIDWKLEIIDKLNHDCIRMVMKSTEPASTSKHVFPHEDCWHVDFMREEPDNLCRAYTPISTSKQYREGTLEFMIKIYKDGQMTQWLNTLKVGDLLPVSSPLPTVVPETYVDGLFMVAGGSAVTVAIQLCDAVLKIQRDPPIQVSLALCNRTLEDVLYTDVLDEMLQKYASFNLTHCLSQGRPPDPLPSGRAVWRIGRLSKDVMKSAEGSSMKGVVSGPRGLCRKALDLWLAVGRDEGSFNVLDELGPPQPEEPDPPAPVPESDAPVPAPTGDEVQNVEKPPVPVLAPVQTPAEQVVDAKKRGGFLYGLFACCTPPAVQPSVDG